MENTFHYRFFLICNQLANSMMGYKPQNFATLMVEEENGKFMNSQMTKYFRMADEFLSNLIGNYPEFMWEELDIEKIAELDVEVIIEDFDNYCDGMMDLKVIESE